jgi:hypothetical protein
LGKRDDGKVKTRLVPDPIRGPVVTQRWKPVLNAFAITFGDRWPDAETY